MILSFEFEAVNLKLYAIITLLFGAVSRSDCYINTQQLSYCINRALSLRVINNNFIFVCLFGLHFLGRRLNRITELKTFFLIMINIKLLKEASYSCVNNKQVNVDAIKDNRPKLFGFSASTWGVIFINISTWKSI